MNKILFGSMIMIVTRDYGEKEQTDNLEPPPYN